MDLSKAFDRLPHGLIISKLHAYGVSTPACELLFTYLHGRKQRVKISTSRSSLDYIIERGASGVYSRPVAVYIFINDLFLFIEKCKLYNYANDNSLDSSSDDLLEAMLNLKRDGRNAIDWFTKNGMRANPDKFHLLSPSPVENQVLELCDGTILISEAAVTVLGVTIDDTLSFHEHISVCCTKAARQLNALARIAKHLDVGSRRTIYNRFVMSNFNHCPLVWHFCGKTNNQKLEKIQERALRILYDDYISTYDTLLEKAGTNTLLINRLRLMALTVFKSLN